MQKRTTLKNNERKYNKKEFDQQMTEFAKVMKE